MRDSILAQTLLLYMSNPLTDAITHTHVRPHLPLWPLKEQLPVCRPSVIPTTEPQAAAPDSLACPSFHVALPGWAAGAGGAGSSPSTRVEAPWLFTRAGAGSSGGPKMLELPPPGGFSTLCRGRHTGRRVRDHMGGQCEPYRPMESVAAQ